MIEKFAPNDNP